jgi:Ni,Fe-hydrogenase maturation factor
MPKDVVIIAIEAENVTDFGESLTPEVEKAVSIAIKQVLEEVKQP